MRLRESHSRHRGLLVLAGFGRSLSDMCLVLGREDGIARHMRACAGPGRKFCTGGDGVCRKPFIQASSTKPQRALPWLRLLPPGSLLRSTFGRPCCSRLATDKYRPDTFLFVLEGFGKVPVLVALQCIGRVQRGAATRTHILRYWPLRGATSCSSLPGVVPIRRPRLSLLLERTSTAAAGGFAVTSSDGLLDVGLALGGPRGWSPRKELLDAVVPSPLLFGREEVARRWVALCS